MHPHQLPHSLLHRRALIHQASLLFPRLILLATMLLALPPAVADKKESLYDRIEMPKANISHVYRKTDPNTFTEGSEINYDRVYKSKLKTETTICKCCKPIKSRASLAIYLFDTQFQVLEFIYTHPTAKAMKHSATLSPQKIEFHGQDNGRKTDFGSKKPTKNMVNSTSQLAEFLSYFYDAKDGERLLRLLKENKKVMVRVYGKNSELRFNMSKSQRQGPMDMLELDIINEGTKKLGD